MTQTDISPSPDENNSKARKTRQEAHLGGKSDHAAFCFGWLRQIATDPNVQPMAVKVGVCLQFYFNAERGSEAWPSIARLARDAGGISARCVQKAVKNLRECGHLIVVVSAGGNDKSTNTFKPILRANNGSGVNVGSGVSNGSGVNNGSRTPEQIGSGPLNNGSPNSLSETLSSHLERDEFEDEEETLEPIEADPKRWMGMLHAEQTLWHALHRLAEQSQLLHLDRFATQAQWDERDRLFDRIEARTWDGIYRDLPEFDDQTPFPELSDEEEREMKQAIDSIVYGQSVADRPEKVRIAAALCIMDSQHE